MTYNINHFPLFKKIFKCIVINIILTKQHTFEIQFMHI